MTGLASGASLSSGRRRGHPSEHSPPPSTGRDSCTSNPDEEELLAAKMMGRWRSGAPLVLCPERDDPELGADSQRNDNFLYGADDDVRGFKCPLGSHARRMSPRDRLAVGNVNLHRMIRRGTTYGPPLPEGVREDDGAEDQPGPLRRCDRRDGFGSFASTPTNGYCRSRCP